MHTPMLACPLKETSEIDWAQPLKSYIAHHYSDDPEKYSEECATLNRLRQDVKACENDSATARDLLYRYYGQLELLDLRFPVDETHIKILFNWFDAFTDLPTSQYSMAYEKASTIFNIAAVLSRHAAEQPRHDSVALKTAYHEFQASAGMFTYINENFLHAPSSDLSRECVKTLTVIMLAQAQEVFLEKAITDGKNDGLLAKLASQAAYLNLQASEGLHDHGHDAGIDRVWLQLVQFKRPYLASVANFYQGKVDEASAHYGVAIARTDLAQRQAKEAGKFASAFPTTVSPDSRLPSDSASTIVSMAKQQTLKCSERLSQLNKDNDYVYHHKVPTEAELTEVSKMPAAKPIPIGEIYQSPEVQRAIGPDIFQSIVPMSVTESASLYDEEKAKLVRAEGERVEQANSELATSLDFMKLPGSLAILKGDLNQEAHVDEEFYTWCQDLTAHEDLGQELQAFDADRADLMRRLDGNSAGLDTEESICEKMRTKYGGRWTQQPSSRLTLTLRNDIRSCRDAIAKAATSDQQLLSAYKQAEPDMRAMRAAAETNEIEALFQQAMASSRGSGPKASGFGAQGNLLDDLDDEPADSVASRIAVIEDLLRTLQLVKRERLQVFKDLKDKVHEDDISNILILNKKAVSSHDNQIFKAELDKFRPHQNRLLQTTHKQHSLVKQLTQTYRDLLADKRVKAEQDKYEAFTRQKSAVLAKYRKIHSSYKDLQTGLDRARGFYSQIKESIGSLNQNVETFLGNRKVEGMQLLRTIESTRAMSADMQSQDDKNKLADAMARMHVNAPPSIVGAGPYHAATSPLQQLAHFSGGQYPHNNNNNNNSPSQTALGGYMQQQAGVQYQHSSQPPTPANSAYTSLSPTGNLYAQHSQSPAHDPGPISQSGPLQPFAHVTTQSSPGQGTFSPANGNTNQHTAQENPWAGLSAWK